MIFKTYHNWGGGGGVTHFTEDAGYSLFINISYKYPAILCKHGLNPVN